MITMNSYYAYSLRYPLYNMWGCMFSVSLVMIERIYILCLIIIIKSKVWTITHCLGFSHETMVSAVCLSIFLCPSISKTSNSLNSGNAIKGTNLFACHCSVYQNIDKLNNNSEVTAQDEYKIWWWIWNIIRFISNNQHHTPMNYSITAYI